MMKRFIGILVSILLVVLIWTIPLFDSLSTGGRLMLSLIFFCVVWWMFTIIPTAVTALVFLLAALVLKLGGPADLLRFWTLPTAWLVLAAFLISTAVSRCGLAERIARFFINRMHKSYRGIIALIYILGLILSLLIPQPFPRAILLMTIIRTLLKSFETDQADRAAIGFAVFSSVTATSMIFLTGDSVLNVVALSLYDLQASWLQWLLWMAIPGLAASLLMFSLQLLIFRPSKNFRVLPDLQEKSQNKNGVSACERNVSIWISLAILLWITEPLTGLDPAWSALLAVIGLYLPKIGGELKLRDIIHEIPWSVMTFVTVAFAIGTLAQQNGITDWITSEFLQSSAFNGIEALYLTGGITMLIHMLVGSALTTLSVTAPIFDQIAAQAHLDARLFALTAYLFVNLHYLFPFQHVTILLGFGKTGEYDGREVLKMGLGMTIGVFLVLSAAIAWWRVVGLIQV